MIKLNIPEKVKIGGFIIKVKEVADLMIERDHLGEYHPKYQEIHIDDSHTRQQKEETFMHELFEAVDSIYNIQLEHDKMTLLATVFHQVLKDNDLNIRALQ